MRTRIGCRSRFTELDIVGLKGTPGFDLQFDRALLGQRSKYSRAWFFAAATFRGCTRLVLGSRTAGNAGLCGFGSGKI
jgi:hypothetical protein